MGRVVVTGLGLLTPLGVGAEPTWQGLVEGRSAIGPLRGYDPSSLSTRIGGEIADFAPQEFVTQRRQLRMMTRNDQLALAGATLAVRDAQLDLATGDLERAGLFVGSNKEISNPMSLLDGALVARNPDGSVDMRRMGQEAASAFYPLFYVEGLQAASLFYISQAFGLKGANTYFAGAAESGLVALGRAFRAIRRGEVDVAIAGGFDDASSWWNMTKFDALGILTTRNDLGAAACRPYDRGRDGTVLGEGAALLVLETYESAVRRGARLYAEITGFGEGYDAYKLLTPHPEGRGLARAMRAALQDADSSPDAIDYVATHGSGTRLGDASEARALRTVFGAAADRLRASSVKPATGHLIGGAGALNAAVAALALYHQTVPPTLNLTDRDPACDLDWVPGEARRIHVERVLALARGLEGQNAALAMRAVR
jgi:3-oxoacyl-[acyl-carrier-protein] synthase II